MIIDISPGVGEHSAVWPGDTPFSLEWGARMEKGASCNVASITTTPHVGAHADGPLHFLPGGEPIGMVDLNPYVGLCRVVDLTGAQVIDDEALTGIELYGAERVLFKTGTSPDAQQWPEEFAYFQPSTIERFGRMKIKLVGIDTPSVDPFHSKDLPAHHALVQAGIRNLEGLDLSEVEEGSYELIALPLKLLQCDSSPVRAVLRTLET